MNSRMTHRELVRYQSLGGQGKVRPVKCLNNSSHPLPYVDVDNPDLALKCVIKDCGFYRTIGLSEQQSMLIKMSMLETLERKLNSDAP